MLLRLSTGLASDRLRACGEQDTLLPLYANTMLFAYWSRRRSCGVVGGHSYSSEQLAEGDFAQLALRSPTAI